MDWWRCIIIDMRDSEREEMKEAGLWTIGLIIFGVLLQMLVGWNPYSALIYVAAPTLFIYIPFLLFYGIDRFGYRFFSKEAKLRREKKKEINRLKSQERALEVEREARAEQMRRTYSLRRQANIERQQQKEKEERIKSFLKSYPNFVKLVKGYCSFFIFSFPFLRNLLLGYVILVFGFVVIPTMIDGIFFDQQYEEIVSIPLMTFISSDFYYYVGSFGNAYQDLLFGMAIVIIALFFYGKSKVKKWEKIEKQET